MNNRITPSSITVLDNNQIFVFGSNLSGFHGAGAAKTALRWGAVMGLSDGLQGQTYAIPTKDKTITRTLTIDEIKPYVDEFILFAKNNNKFGDDEDLIFLVTEIGCGLANHKPEDIAPLFRDAMTVENIYLPKRFWKVLYELLLNSY